MNHNGKPVNDQPFEALFPFVSGTIDAMERNLHGLPPDMQGAMLAHLLAKWLCGHMMLDDGDVINRVETDALREHLVEVHLAFVASLLPIEEEHLMENIKSGRPPDR